MSRGPLSMIYMLSSIKIGLEEAKLCKTKQPVTHMWRS